jgi:hypothetical protein
MRRTPPLPPERHRPATPRASAHAIPRPLPPRQTRRPATPAANPTRPVGVV